jgi:hypothetical protein
MTIELERNPMPAGEPTWSTSTITNTGPDNLVWFHDGCADAVYVKGLMEGTTWRPGVKDQTGAALEYRKFALESIGVDHGEVWIVFQPEEFLDQKGSYGCADVGMSDRIAPGAAIVQRERWDGFAGMLLGPPPTGRVPVIGTFRYYWRESDGEPEDITTRTFDVHLEAWVVESGKPRVHPAEAIDAALTDERLVDVIEARDFRNGNEPVVRFDPGEGVWEVGLLDYTEPPIVHLVLVDGFSGVVSGWEERIWNYDTDGFP